jgi:hypothetical protein
MKLRATLGFCLCASVGMFAQTPVMMNLSPRGTGRVGAVGTASAATASPGRRAKPFRRVKPLAVTPSAAAFPIPNPAPLAVTTPGSGFGGFFGLTNLDQVAAGTGAYAHSQFDLEPPDQGLAVGNGFVVEAVNLAISVYNKQTGVLVAGPSPLNQFLNLGPAVNQVTGQFGPSLSDPRVEYDPSLQRWFFTILEFDVDPNSGGLTGRSHLEIAVSQSPDPTGVWLLYSLDTTNDGSNGTPNNPNCPCFGDQPLSGLDANGFYVTTNEFPLFAPGFNGANVYAMSKTRLAQGQNVAVVTFNNLPLAGNQAYSLQPATTPPGTPYAPNMEFMLSALEFYGVGDNRIALWALMNTSSLNSSTPSVQLTHTVVSSEIYFPPSPVVQKAGSIPLGQSVGDPEAPVESNDDRMNQVVYLNGFVWGALNTAVRGPNNSMAVGTAWFAVKPSIFGAALTGKVYNQGYVSVAPDSVVFPSVALNAAGKGLIAFSLIGPNYYPSAAYIPVSGAGTANAIVQAAAGVAPEDGFTGYLTLFPPQFGGDGVARWGDYSAAAVDSDGSVWFGAEMIPTTSFRTLYANWGTFIGRVVP